MNLGLQSLVSDIAVAMFKVASVISHPTLKSELEDQAVSLSANPSLDTIISSENLITLGRETGDIKPINAVVLIRELESLKKGLSATPVVIDETKNDVDISAKFVRSKPVQPSNNPIRSPRDSDNSDKQEPVQVISKKTRPSFSKKNSINSDKVYQYIVEHKEAKLKELEAAFEEISGRTIRRMTDSLIKTGKIERVGNPGPTSFYRLAGFKPDPSVRFYDEDEKEPVSPPIAQKTETKELNNSLGEDVPQLSYSDNSEVIAL